MSAQIAKRYTIVELTDEATPLVLIGIGWFKDEHIQANIKRMRLISIRESHSSPEYDSKEQTLAWFRFFKWTKEEE